MKLNKYLAKLAYGTLSNLWGSSSIKGSIPEDKIPLVINAINDGLMDLYTKFSLKENELYVELNEHTTLYTLTSDHIIPDGTPEEDLDTIENCDKYIWDFKENPFTDNIIKILDVITTDGFPVKLNDPHSPIAIFTPTFNTLQVPNPIRGVVLSVVYQAKHPILTIENLAEQEIELTPTLYRALDAYVAYLVHSNMNTENSVSNAQKYYALYQEIINEIISTDAVSSSYSQTNIKFLEGGWC